MNKSETGQCVSYALLFTVNCNTGVPVSEYVLNRRIDTAKNMLLYSEYSASQISEILTFSSQSHFIRVFKKKEGMTPREYKVLHDRDSLRAAAE